MHDTNSNVPVVVRPPPARPRSNSQGMVADHSNVVGEGYTGFFAAKR